MNREQLSNYQDFESKGEERSVFMRKKIRLLCIFFISLILVACANDEESVTDGQADSEGRNPEQLVGEHITINDSSIELPFDNQITDAHYSEDDRVKLFVTNDFLVVVEDTEIIHSVKMDRANPDPTVSKDGRFAIWRESKSNSDDTITVFDTEDRSVDHVSKDEKYDPFNIYQFLPLIEKLDDEYYLVTNGYIYGFDVDYALNLNTKKMYSSEYPEDQDVLEQLKPEAVYAGQEKTVEIDNWSAQNNLRGTEQSYYGYYRSYYDSEKLQSIDQLYIVYTPEARLIDLELEKHGIDLADKETNALNDVLVSDSGNLVITQYEKNSNDHYKMYTYYIDLTSSTIEPVLVYENEFEKDKKNVLFNHDSSAIYIVGRGEIQVVALK